MRGVASGMSSCFRYLPARGATACALRGVRRLAYSPAPPKAARQALRSNSSTGHAAASRAVGTVTTASGAELPHFRIPPPPASALDLRTTAARLEPAAGAQQTTTSAQDRVVLQTRIMGLHACSPIDGRYLLDCMELNAVFSEYSFIRYRIFVELVWLQHLAACDLPEFRGLQTEAAQRDMQAILRGFDSEAAAAVLAIEMRLRHDIKAVETYVTDQFRRKESLAPFAGLVHFGLTSEDVNNLGLTLMIKSARDGPVTASLDAVLEELVSRVTKLSNAVMPARTHGQIASPTTLGKELAVFARRLKQTAAQVRGADLTGKLNGAVGNFSALTVTYPDVDWISVSERFVTRLGLVNNPATTQIEGYDATAALLAAVAAANNVLIDFCRDMWTYTSLGYFKQRVVSQEVGSSTMPHKVNPIDFENAEGNLGIANALLMHLHGKLTISRLQRDLSDSTARRNIGVAFSHTFLATRSILKGLSRVEPNLTCMQHEADSNWEVLAEPIQTVMRRYQLPDPYTQLKAFSRGKQLDRQVVHDFIQSLDIPQSHKASLMALTPATYVGDADRIARRVATEVMEYLASRKPGIEDPTPQ